MAEEAVSQTIIVGNKTYRAGKCAIPGCDVVGRRTRGLCEKHYLRWRRNGDPHVSRIDREWGGKPCSVDGCERPTKARRMCERHYSEWMREPGRVVRSEDRAAIHLLSDTDAAYIAGMIDADGMVTAVVANGPPRAMVVVTNGNFGLVRWLTETIGAGTSYRTKSAPRRPDQDESNWNPVHRYQITGRKAQSLLERCRPYMKVKARQADLAMRLPMRGRDFRSTPSAEQATDAAELLREIRALNRRGRKSDDVIDWFANVE